MADDTTEQEARYTQQVSATEAQTWVAEEQSFSGLDALSDPMFSEALFGAAREAKKKSLILQNFALDRWLLIRTNDPNQYLALVVQPASDLGVSRMLLEEALANRLRSRNGLSHGGAYPHPQSGSTILDTFYPPPVFFVQGMLHHGLTLIAGKMKRGKSYLALHMAMDISFGRKAFYSLDTIKSRVLYVSLEDHPPLIQDRLKKIQPNLRTLPDLDFIYELPALGAGALEALQHYVAQDGYRVIIIDTIGRVTPDFGAQRRSMNEYATVTNILGPLQKWANESQVAVVMIDHVRKAESDDIFDTILGTSAKLGVADHGIVYQRKDYDNDALLHMRGRWTGDDKIILTLVDGHLEFLGQGEQYDLSREQRNILKALQEEGLPMKIQEIMSTCGVSAGQYARFKKILQRMVKEGFIDRTGHGAYCALKRADYDDSDIEMTEERERYP